MAEITTSYVKMDFEDFLKLSRYCNDNWKGCFTEHEIVENALDYTLEYDESISRNEPTYTMNQLCYLICEDMDVLDYVDCNCEVDIDTMQSIIKEFFNDCVLQKGM